MEKIIISLTYPGLQGHTANTEIEVTSNECFDVVARYCAQYKALISRSINKLSVFYYNPPADILEVLKYCK